MEDLELLRRLSARLTGIRAAIGRDRPFFGRLLLRLPTRFAPCGTACTDMRSIVFDPAFAQRLDDPELKFVYLHELMHCVLRHCSRARGKDQLRYNLACDIVVNSMLLEVAELPGGTLDGQPLLHLAPNGTEGREHTAEAVYDMLRRRPDQSLPSGGTTDDHRVWGMLSPGGHEDQSWDRLVREASKVAGVGSGIPSGLRRQLRQVIHHSTTNWRQLLQDHLRCDRSDYTYDVPDRRYGDDIFMPSFHDDPESSRVDRIWVLIDTSGSVNSKALSVAFAEIADAASQVGTMTGCLSFFDHQVSEPVPFSTVEELTSIQPVGGGGTSFEAIFRYLREHLLRDPPALIVILTDGHAPIPSREKALGIDVVWVIIDSDVTPDWGSCIHVDL